MFISCLFLQVLPLVYQPLVVAVGWPPLGPSWGCAPPEPASSTRRAWSGIEFDPNHPGTEKNATDPIIWTFLQSNTNCSRQFERGKIRFLSTSDICWWDSYYITCIYIYIDYHTLICLFPRNLKFHPCPCLSFAPRDLHPLFWSQSNPPVESPSPGLHSSAGDHHRPALPDD